MSSREEKDERHMAAITPGKDDKEAAQIGIRVLPSASAVDSSVPRGQTELDIEPRKRKKPVNKKGRSKAKATARLDAKNVVEVDNLIKGNRSIDTLLRNAYRAQLDMLALAATKANIMISLNGLLMSMLIISGTHLISINGMYIIPIAIFLVTCATATTFAVFAARPEISRKKYKYNDFVQDEARLMVFEEFSDLQETEYIDAMTDLLRNPKRVYRSMLAHIHDLGTTADKKYQNLYYSYTAFMAGTIITVLSLLALAVLKWSGTLALA